MFQYVLIFLLVILAQSDSRCTSQNEKAQCDSVDGLKKAGEQNEWTEILIKSVEPKQTIKLNTFSKIPNLNSIMLENSVNNIEDRAFARLSSLLLIMFDKCDLPVIKRNWFSKLPITLLRIFDSKVRSFESNCFEGLTNLEIVLLNFNNISHIPVKTFNGTFIKKLFLDNNQIAFIEPGAFANMINLEDLWLHENFLTTFNPKLIMGNARSNLKILDLENNQIKHLIKDNFVDFPNISKIHLGSNELELIHDGAFNGLTKLKKITLSNNKLKSFPERALPFNGLPSLETLFLHNNRFNYLPRSFIRYFPKLFEISIFGNPWQCACYKEIMNSIYHNNVKIICGKEYLNGKKPVCVVPQTSSDKCVEYIQNADDLYETYKEAEKEYRLSEDNCLK